MNWFKFLCGQHGCAGVSQHDAAPTRCPVCNNPLIEPAQRVQHDVQALAGGAVGLVEAVAAGVVGSVVADHVAPAVAQLDAASQALLTAGADVSALRDLARSAGGVEAAP